MLHPNGIASCSSLIKLMPNLLYGLVFYNGFNSWCGLPMRHGILLGEAPIIYHWQVGGHMFWLIPSHMMCHRAWDSQSFVFHWFPLIDYGLLSWLIHTYIQLEIHRCEKSYTLHSLVGYINPGTLIIPHPLIQPQFILAYYLSKLKLYQNN